jgi:hypothetical protein
MQKTTTLVKSKITFLLIAFLFGAVLSSVWTIQQGSVALASNHNLAANTNRSTTQQSNANAAAAKAAAQGAAAAAAAQAASQAFPEDGSGGFVPCGNTADNPCNVTHLFRAFVVIINYLIGMAGFVAVFAIIYAGFQMVMSQGTERLTSAKRQLSGAIIGMVIVATAFVLVNALFSGSLSLGVCNGGDIFANPRAYIQGNGSCN